MDLQCFTPSKKDILAYKDKYKVNLDIKVLFKVKFLQFHREATDAWPKYLPRDGFISLWLIKWQLRGQANNKTNYRFPNEVYIKKYYRKSNAKAMQTSA